VVNSIFDDILPDVSKDELSLYFSSDRPGSEGYDIWFSQRTSKTAPWSTPQNLYLINTSANDRTPTLSRDGHFLFFVSDRPGTLGGLDIWASWRQHTNNDLGWQEPKHLGEINSAFNDAGPSFFQDEESGIVSLHFASNRPGGVGLFDIYVSHLNSAGRFGPAELVPELSSPLVDLRPALRHDGLEVYLNSNRVGTLGGFDLWVSTRGNILGNWSTPVNLGNTINTGSSEMFPALSSDGKTLYFNSERIKDPPSEDLDLYMTTRTKGGQP
jgi:Tol biopolymer transport system component